jgi:CO dehydrogenase/acetyl-CoA synthase beta subunit
MLQKLKEEVKQWIEEDQVLQAKIAQALSKRNVVTVKRWLSKDHPILTSITILEIIREHRGLPKEDELTEEVSHGNKAIA